MVFKRPLLMIGQQMLTVSVMALLLALPVRAESGRFTVIDARDGLTEEALQAYTQALSGKASSPMTKGRIQVHVTAKNGFVAPDILVPENKRNVDVDVTVVVHGGGSQRGDIRVNHLDVSRRRPPTVIKQTSRVK